MTEAPEIDPNTIFSEQVRFAWEHFKFHAEQRTRMFHFFLLAVTLLVSAFSVLFVSKEIAHRELAFLVLFAGGVISTFFLSLDVRNVQLLEQSENLLRKIEEDILYKGWLGKIGDIEFKLGIFSREAVLKDYLRSNNRNYIEKILRWVCVNNIKHKFSIRAIQILTILSFWLGALAAAPSKSIIFLIVGFVFLLCLGWGIWALASPQRDLKREGEALKRLLGK